MRPTTPPPFPPDRGSPSIADLAADKTVRTIENMARDGIFDTADEVDEFIAFVAEQRRNNLA
jgi:hypothetical protein